MPATRAERRLESISPAKSAGDRALAFLDNLPQEQSPRLVGKTYGGNKRRQVTTARPGTAAASESSKKMPYVMVPRLSSRVKRQHSALSDHEEKNGEVQSASTARRAVKPSVVIRRRREIPDDDDNNNDNFPALEAPVPSAQSALPGKRVLKPYVDLKRMSKPPLSTTAVQSAPPATRLSKPYVDLRKVIKPKPTAQSAPPGRRVVKRSVVVKGGRVPDSSSTSTGTASQKKQPYVLVPSIDAKARRHHVDFETLEEIEERIKARG